VWLAVLLVSLAAFIHQGYTINIFAIVSDIYPKKAVGSVTGLAGFSGAVGGLLFSCAAGLILEYTGSYYFLFGLASIAYLLCWLFLKLLIADDKTVKI
jgi:ACS family hexuronate transporter-like MFS transporter